MGLQVDPAEGKIIIDGIDISTIGIQDLRSRIVGQPTSFLLSLAEPGNSVDLHSSSALLTTRDS